MLPQNIKRIISAALALAGAAGLFSCKETVVPHYFVEDAPLMVGGSVTTKTFFGSANFSDTTNRVKILDYITMEGQSESAAPHINDDLYLNRAGSISQGTESEFVWSLSGRPYFWTSEGTHRFISWLTYDAALDLGTGAFFGAEPTLSNANTVLTLPAKTFNSATPKYDFVYSDAVKRNLDVENPDYSSVRLNYKHLFTAFSIGARNWTSDLVIIKSFKLINMPDTKEGVAITYKTTAEGGSVTTAGTTEATSGNPDKEFFKAENLDLQLAEGDVIPDLFNPAGTQAADYMMWPLTAAQLSDPNPGTDEYGRVKASPDAPQMVLTYEIAGSETTRYIPFPDMEMRAGKIYHFELHFVQKEIRLNFEVLPWDYEVLNLSYRTDAVQGDEVYYDSNTCVLDNDNYTVTYNGTPILASFGITLPANATFLVSMTGDVNYFKLRYDRTSSYFRLVYGEDADNPNVNPLTGPVHPEIDGGMVRFKIVPLTSLDRSVDRKIVLDFKIRTGSGQIVDAQSELNRGRYEIILPAE